MDFEKEFCEIDFSPLSTIKETLRQRLLNDWQNKIELSEDDLEFLAAAGNNQKIFPDCLQSANEK